MKKYIVIHDTTLLGESTIPGISGINAVNGGYGRGAVLYGNIVQKYRVGVGYQNFLQVSTRDKFNGLYVPVTAVAEVPVSLTDSGSPVLQSGRLASSSNESNNEANNVSTQNGTTEPSNPSADNKETWTSKNRGSIAIAVKIILIILILVLFYRVWKDNK